MRISRGIATLSVAALTVVGLTACSSDSDSAKTSTRVSTESKTPTEDVTPDDTDEATPTEEATTDAPEASGDGMSPAWAIPTTTPGTLLTTVTGSNFTVDIYQVSTAVASKTGQFVNPDTNTPIIDTGDEIVYVNYVFTNTSSEVIPLTYSLVSMSPRYADWPYMQGMDSIVDSAQFEEMDVTASSIAPTGDFEAPFAWAPGETFSNGANFKYQAGSPIDFTARLTPADEAGDLVHDLRQEIVASTTIS
ncbi:hypothetical protein SAMN05216410_0583 [Sanguibacter gelidistatuariae]|uniref:DUF4352 domain-containing protein n=1 Tax=Sanguibacter gelidistatuariae TaxID=1814289 RepID=A0A1G6GZE1_9MICO|nr:hypothetical protein [Sanguibacter gelidistatuariae]SDB87045.1 hypothetical protein SAMN05216410_0583 [Sanguibacter gelidistatuariae]